ncbi:MAG: DUF3303 domain-containing protein [Candidatus Thorarchaeota archaeon]
MLFISYWELNENFDPSKMAELGQKLMEKKLFPVEGVKLIGWYMSAGDMWGVTISEAENAEQIARGNNMWRIAHPGFFKFIKTTPALEVTKAIPIGLKLAKDIKG